ncbi:hypothetical protein [Oceanirhabdus sp. W0125-5]|uniref:hypothetical protein n=1 Tax=Oceanirhabdus sp. W0125-5 TaxID=2999116 RepID=UPI0022F2F636|nr:hypothetical protein [Oceanirhabdus sp. W0125-5]WBW95115.1 hypothetical protein OW730_15630 [Oceanirhabdus sp. W0125-5]
MIIYHDSHYYIKKSRRGYVVINANGDYKNHSHFKNIGPAKKCIYLTKNKILPKSSYMMIACMRISTDELYIKRILKLREIKDNKSNVKYKNKKVLNKKSGCA